MTLFCLILPLILPMAGTDFYSSGVQRQQSFSKWSFLYKYAYYPIASFQLHPSYLVPSPHQRGQIKEKC